MKMQKLFLVTLAMSISLVSEAQDIGYEIKGSQTSQFGLVTLDTLKNAVILSDIFARYDSSWVARYISVELSSDCGGRIEKAYAPNDTLTAEQLTVLHNAEQGCSIHVKVEYIPDNSLKDNPPRKMQFSLSVVPVYEAKFPGGMDALSRYIEEQVISRIRSRPGWQIEMAGLTFSIDTYGHPVDIRLSDPCDEETDALLIKAIQNMPNWLPAMNAEGMLLKQEFNFRIGTELLNGC